MKFLVDSMLGHIAMWLRLLGYDTYYEIDADDTHLLTLAANDHRILITRDIELCNRAKSKSIPCILLENNSHEEQLAYVIAAYNLRRIPDPNFSRCVHCNGKLIKVDKEHVKNRVPEKVYNYHEVFWVCLKCNQVYYVGKHWKNILEFFKKVNSILDKSIM